MATPPEMAAVVISPSSTTIWAPLIQLDPAFRFHVLVFTKSQYINKTKYNNVVAHLPLDIPTLVPDVIIQLNNSDPQEDSKSKIIVRFSEAKTQQIRHLLAGESLHDRQLSDLLRYMKRCAQNHNIDDSLLFELFNQPMAVPVQTVIAFFHPISSEKATEVTDGILKINPNSIQVVSSGGTGNT